MYSGKSFLAVAILLAFGTITVSARNCPKACTLELNQVCATNGKQYRLFDNPCEMDVFNCEHEFLWTRTKSLAPCLADKTAISADIENCVTPCTMEYNPTCAFDGKDYRLFENTCEMHNAECGTDKHYEVASLFHCLARSVDSDCVRPCEVDFAPVCAYDGESYQLFDNVCQMHNAECGTNKHFIPAPFVACVVTPKAVGPISSNCETMCTMEFNPVCGFNGVEHKIFSNLCTMNNEHCKDNKMWRQTRMQECSEPVPFESNIDCDKPCTFEYNPVCGFNGYSHEVFPNVCSLEHAHCKDGKKWVPTPFMDCIEPVSTENKDGDNCVKPCNKMLAPVCGFNGVEHKIFSNICTMNNEHCKDNKVWKQTRMQECSEPIPFESNKCIKPCNKMFAPICGTDGQHYKIFNNECDMKNEHCFDHHEWKMAPFSLCQQKPKEECIKICPRIYAPVCGSDGQTYKVFDNLCLLEKEKECDGHEWKTTTFEHCEHPIPLSNQIQSNGIDANCEKPCTFEHNPVCGSNGVEKKIFSNICTMNNEHCKDHKIWKQTRMQECSEPVPFKSEKCVKPCNKMFAPICGTDGQHYKIFNNECNMENEHCFDHHDWKMAPFSLCQQKPKEECIKICPRIYAPVCGSDGQTYKIFDNQCLLEKEKECDGHEWKTTTFEHCEHPIPLSASNKKNCPMICPLNYAPVCGFNGKTYHIFANGCELNSFNCQNDEHFVAKRMSECPHVEPYVADEEVFVCPDNYDPQCGFDGFSYKIFANQCMMDNYNRGHKTAPFSHVEFNTCKILL